jgi:hypothetical protein
LHASPVLEYCNMLSALFYVVSDAQPQVWFQDLACHWHYLAASFADYFRCVPVADFKIIASSVVFLLSPSTSESSPQNLRHASWSSQLAVSNFSCFANSRALPLSACDSDVTRAKVLLYACRIGSHQRTMVQVTCGACCYERALCDMSWFPAGTLPVIA